MTRHAVITGAGVVTPFGDLAQTAAAVANGRIAVGEVRSFDASSFACSRAAEIEGLDARPWFRNAKALKLTDRRTRFAVVAAARAVVDAGLPLIDDERLGVLVGTSGADVQTEDVGRALGAGDANDVDWFASRVLRRLHPLWLLVNLANMASAHVAIQLGARGPNSTITTDWIAGVQAISEAALWIEAGEADAVVAGGADTGVLPFAFGSFEAGGLFERGFVPGEGAAMFVLEERERAEARGARIVARIDGSGAVSGAESYPVDDRVLEAQLGHALAAATPITLAVLMEWVRSAANEPQTIRATSSSPSGLHASVVVDLLAAHAAERSLAESASAAAQ